MIISIKKAGFILSALALCLSACRGGGGDEPTPAGIPAFPGAEVIEITEDGMTPVDYRDTEHYQVMLSFLENPDKMLGYLLDD